jgi:hypothetical protein
MFEDVPRLDGTGDVQNAGSVNIIYGSAAGLTDAGNQFWTQNSPGIQDEANEGDLMGRALGSGDLNADGFEDLAIGIRGENVNGQNNAGAFAVLYGSAAGLSANGNQLWTQDSPDILEEAQKEDWLGRTGVTAGDFNADGYDDVAVGALQDDVDGVINAGVVNVLYGSPDGLTSNGNQLFTENTEGSNSDGASYGDRFGRTVEAADFNGDGFEDLAVGISNERVGRFKSAGATVILYGSAAGLTEDGNQWWNQDSPGILDHAEIADSFDGRVPDVGDANGDGYADICIGVFKENLEGSTTIEDAGAMNVIYGGPAGLAADAGPGNQFWNLQSPGIRGVAHNQDAYAQSNVGC